LHFSVEAHKTAIAPQAFNTANSTKKGRNSVRPNTPRIDPGDSFSTGIFVFYPVESGLSN
jgi:hypothetical protein